MVFLINLRVFFKGMFKDEIYFCVKYWVMIDLRFILFFKVFKFCIKIIFFKGVLFKGFLRLFL